MRYGVRQPVNLGPLPCWRLPSYRTPSNSLGYAQWRLGAGATSQHGSSAAGWCGGRCDLLGQAGGASWGLAGLHHRLPVQGLGLGEDGPAACCPPLRRLASNPEYRLCVRSLCTAMAIAFFCPISTTSFLPRVIPV